MSLPPSPSDNSSSPASKYSPLAPPVSEITSDNTNNPASTTVPTGKRKPSRRANTAERRATHNAVERQRRETLNGRFLDLAGLLPSLSQVRRPSKSAIVNSSIAHIHASCRHRFVAARELRLVKQEADALRRELNEWRDRSALPRVEEPVRGDGFNMILSGEVEVVVPTGADDEEGMDNEDGDDDLNYNRAAASSADDVDDIAQAATAALLSSNSSIPPQSSSPPIPLANSQPPVINNVHSRPQSVSGGSAMAQLLNSNQQPHGPQTLIQHGVRGGPVIASQTPPISYENPAIASVYDTFIPNQLQAAQYGLGFGSFGANQLPPHILGQLAAEMENKAAPVWYNNMGQYTPPSGGGSPLGSPFGMTNGGYQRRDSVTSMESDRSVGSIPKASPVPNYELVGGHTFGNVPRWTGNDGLNDAMRMGPTIGNTPIYSMMM